MRRGFIIVAVLVVVTAAIFGQSLSHDFIIWDDDKNIYKNPYIATEEGRNPWVFWKGSYLGLYIPVTYTVWSLLGSMSGKVDMPEAHTEPVFSATLFHGANVVLHLGATLLVLLLIYRLLGRRDLLAAALGACLFAFHPLQVEPVAWATGMKDVLSVFLALVSMVLFLRQTELVDVGRIRRAAVFYFLALGMFGLALLAKPSLVVVPAILAVIEIFLRGSDWRKSLALPGGFGGGALLRSPGWRLLPFFAIALAFVGITMSGQKDFEEALFPFEPVALWLRPVVALDAIAFYATKLIYPFHLAPEYGRNPAWALEFAGRFPLWLLPLIAGVGALRIRRHRGYYFAAIGIALLGVAPVLGFVPFGYQGQSTVADRYMYLSMFGVALALASALSFAKGRKWYWVAGALAGMLAVSSFVQTGHWESSRKLFRHCLKVNPLSTAAAYNYGLACANLGRDGEALEFYRMAVELKPDFKKALNNLGKVLNEHGRSGEAVGYLERAVETDQEYDLALNNLGIAYANLGRVEEAAATYRRALAIKPDDSNVLFNLGLTEMERGELDEALELFSKAAKLQPEAWRHYWGKGQVYTLAERHGEAVAAFEAVVRLRPKDIGSFRALGRALARNGQFGEAGRVVEEGLAMARARPGVTEEALAPLLKEIESYARGVVP